MFVVIVREPLKTLNFFYIYAYALYIHGGSILINKLPKP